MAVLVQRTQTGASGVNAPKQTAPELEEELAKSSIGVEIRYKLKKRGKKNIVQVTS